MEFRNGMVLGQTSEHQVNRADADHRRAGIRAPLQVFVMPATLTRRCHNVITMVAGHVLRGIRGRVESRFAQNPGREVLVHQS
jgi:hypothetical protein